MTNQSRHCGGKLRISTADSIPASAHHYTRHLFQVEGLLTQYICLSSVIKIKSRYLLQRHTSVFPVLLFEDFSYQLLCTLHEHMNTTYPFGYVHKKLPPKGIDLNTMQCWQRKCSTSTQRSFTLMLRLKIRLVGLLQAFLLTARILLACLLRVTARSWNSMPDNTEHMAQLPLGQCSL